MPLQLSACQYLLMPLTPQCKLIKVKLPSSHWRNISENPSRVEQRYLKTNKQKTSLLYYFQYINAWKCSHIYTKPPSIMVQRDLYMASPLCSYNWCTVTQVTGDFTTEALYAVSQRSSSSQKLTWLLSIPSPILQHHW